MAKLSRSRLTGYVALLINTLLWGLALPIAKRGFDDGLSPITFLQFRFLLAALITLPFVAFSHRRRDVQTTFKHSLPIIVIELIGTVIALIFLYQGVALTTSVESSLIASTWPILVTIGGVILLRERVKSNELVGLLIALAGTAILVGRPLLTNHLTGLSITGNFLILAYALVNALYVLLAKRFYKSFNLFTISHISFWTGAIAFSVLTFKQTGSLIPLDILSLTFWPAFSIAYMAFFGSILGLTLYLFGLNKIEASEASLFTYLQPAIALPASILLLGEPIHPLEITGLIVVILGVYLAEKR